MGSIIVLLLIYYYVNILKYMWQFNMCKSISLLNLNNF